jgi:phosphoribosylanthranilate isomerase
MYLSDEKPRINDYGAISLGFVTKPSERRLSNKEITEIISLNINNKHKIHGEATSSTLVEDLTSHVIRKHK